MRINTLHLEPIFNGADQDFYGQGSGGTSDQGSFDFPIGSDGNVPILLALPMAHGTSSETGSGIGSQTATSTAGFTSDIVSFAGSGIVFDNTFTASVSAAYETCILAAEKIIASEWTNSITINLEFTAKAEGTNGTLASNSWATGAHVSYATLKSALTSLSAQEPSNTVMEQAVANLPSADPSGGAGFKLPEAYARMLGLTSSTGSPDDTVTLNTSYNWSYGQDVINTITHEISEGGMGRVGGLGDQDSLWSTMDLFRYNAAGVPDYTDGRDGQATYFSYDGGKTLSLSAGLTWNNEYNSSDTKINGGDVADFTQHDVFGTGSTGETNTLSLTDLEIMAALGWNPAVTVYAVTSQTIQNDYLAITRTALSLDQATTEATAINASTTTEFQYVNGLLSQVADTTTPVVAVEASMYGAVGSSAVITNLVTNFLPGQLAYAMQAGLDPEVFACLETALVFAFSNKTGATTFANNYGPSHTTMPATAAGDAAFAAAAATAIFGSAQTSNTANALLGYVHFLEGFFTANGISGVQDPTADQIVIAARAGAWGEGVAIALENNLGALPGQVTNFLEDAAQGSAVYSASLSSQPTAAPFQGAATPSAATTVQVTGVAAPVDHIVM